MDCGLLTGLGKTCTLDVVPRRSPREKKSRVLKMVSWNVSVPLAFPVWLGLTCQLQMSSLLIFWSARFAAEEKGEHIPTRIHGERKEEGVSCRLIIETEKRCSSCKKAIGFSPDLPGQAGSGKLSQTRRIVHPFTRLTASFTRTSEKSWLIASLRGAFRNWKKLGISQMTIYSPSAGRSTSSPKYGCINLEIIPRGPG